MDRHTLLTLMDRFVRAFLVFAVIGVASVVVWHSADASQPGCLPADPTCGITPAPYSPPPKTPAPTAKPATPAPKKTTAPTSNYVPPPVSNNTSNFSTPVPTAFPIEVTSPTPAQTTLIETQTLPGDSTSNLNATDTGASASSWIFGFIVGLLIGLLVGRASWGIKRRRRQQIFG